MKHDQQAAIATAFLENLGSGPHSGTEAFRAFLQLERLHPELSQAWRLTLGSPFTPF
jgi:hypothetical protein